MKSLLFLLTFFYRVPKGKGLKQKGVFGGCTVTATIPLGAFSFFSFSVFFSSLYSFLLFFFFFHSTSGGVFWVVSLSGRPIACHADTIGVFLYSCFISFPFFSVCLLLF